MSNVNTGPRRYNAPKRRQQAAATRRHVLRQARQLFVQHGYAATSVSDVAAAAGVGLRSIYDTFGSKRGLLIGILEDLAPQEQEHFHTELEAAAGNPERQLRLAVEFVTTLYTAAGDVLAMVHAAAGADSDLDALNQEGERRRLADQRSTINDWHQRGYLRTDLDTDHAADILWALTSPSLYRSLVVDRGWNLADYRDWLHTQLRTALLNNPPPPETGQRPSPAL